MQRKKILVLLSCSARNKMLIGILAASLIGAGGLLLSGNANISNNMGVNKIVLAQTLNNDGNKACVINGNNSLVLYTSANSSSIKSYVSVGEMLTIHNYSDGYYDVTVQETGATGYISSSNMQKIVSGVGYHLTSLSGTAYVTNVSTVVNVREEATMNSTSLIKIKNGTAVTLLGKQGAWYKIDVNKTIGYIYKEYVAPANSNSVKSTSSTSNKNTLSSKPVITASNITINEGSTFTDSMLKATTNDGAVLTYSGNVNTDKPGTYEVIITATEDGVSSEEVADVTVNPAEPVVTPTLSPNEPTTEPGNEEGVKEAAPTLTANSITIAQGSEFNYSQLEAVASEGATITYNAKVNTSKTGTYRVVITATNSEGTKTQITEYVTVQGAPTISASSISIKYGSTFTNSMLNAKATQDADINYSGEVDTSKAGTYNVEITATNSLGETATKTVVVTVKQPTPTLTANSITIAQGSSFDYSQLGAVANEGATITYSGTVDTSEAGTYTVSITATNSEGVQKTIKEKVTVKEGVPTLTANSITITQGSSFDYSQLGAVASEGATITYKGTVNSNKAGTYTITITATNSHGTKTTLKEKVTVKAPAPTLTAKSVTIAQGSTFSNSQLKAVASKGATITYSGTVDTNKVGTYTITIIATNSEGTQTTVTETVTVQGPPVITASNMSVAYGSTFTDSTLNATVTQDAKLTYSGTVNTSRPGKYSIVITATNSLKQISTKTVVVTVKEAPPKLTANDITIALGSTFNTSQLDAVASEGATITYNQAVNIAKTGTYRVVITATNSQGTKTQKTVYVTVQGAPTISASNMSVAYGSTFAHSMLKATATQGATLTYSGTVNTSEPGKYSVVITAKNSLGLTSTKTVVVTVKPAPKTSTGTTSGTASKTTSRTTQSNTTSEPAETVVKTTTAVEPVEHVGEEVKTETVQHTSTAVTNNANKEATTSSQDAVTKTSK